MDPHRTKCKTKRFSVFGLRLGNLFFSLVLSFCVVPISAETVTVAFAAEPVQIDPTRSTAGVDQYFTTLFYEQLLMRDPDLNQVNALAEHWEIIENEGTTEIHVRIRQDVKFHNGQELTTRDFEYSFKRLRDPLSGARNSLRYVDRFEIIDDYNFKLTLSQADGAIVSLNLILTAIPRDYFERVGDAGVQLHPIGTGPWKFVSRKPREEIVVERFEDYWDKGARSEVQRLVIKIIPEDTTRVAALKTGAVDWIDAVPPALVDNLKAISDIEVVSRPAPNNLFLHINAIDANSPFRKVKVRQAIAHAIDVDAIVKYILHGQGIRTVQLAPGTLGYDPDLEPYSYDPDEARRLLDDAGYPAGISTPCYNLTTPREPHFKEVGETMFAYLNEVGIRCRIVQLEYGAWINVARRNSRPHMDGLLNGMWGQGLPGDPTDAFGGHLHSEGDGWGTYSYFSDALFDMAIEELRTVIDEQKRADMIRGITRRKHEQVAGGFPTYRPLVSIAWRNTLTFKPWPQAFWRSMRQISIQTDSQAEN